MENETATMKKGLQYWQQIIIILCLGWVVIWIYRSVLTPIFPEMQQTIGQHSDAEMGLIASFYFFAYTGMQIPAGILVDKFGKKSRTNSRFLSVRDCCNYYRNSAKLANDLFGKLASRPRLWFLLRFSILAFL